MPTSFAISTAVLQRDTCMRDLEIFEHADHLAAPKEQPCMRRYDASDWSSYSWIRLRHFATVVVG